MLTSPAVDAETIEKLTSFTQKMEDLKRVEKPFHLIIEDCSGNSFIENPYHPEKDLQLVSAKTNRTLLTIEASVTSLQWIDSERRRMLKLPFNLFKEDK